MSPRDRYSDLINGVLMGIGALIVLDNVILHWILQLHRVVSGPMALPIEIALVILGAAMFAFGLWRERRRQ
jgi:uncharacterized membrane protein